MEIKKEEYDQYLSEEYLSVKEASELLQVSEEELRGLVHKHQLPSHNVAGAFLRLKRKDLEELKIKWRIERELFPKKEKVSHENPIAKADFGDKLADFWYFNDFYIVCAVVIMALLYFILAV